MPCCMSDALGWCGALPIKYNDGQGHEFCIFHAPEGKKGVETEEFNNAVFTYIDEQKKTNQKCNLSGTIFDGYIDFSRYHEENPLPILHLNNAVFPFGVSFSQTSFAKGAGFSGAKFFAGADFGGASFQGRASFLLAVFKDDADFSSARFEGEAVFKQAKFTNLTRFLNTCFCDKADFFETELRGKAYFIKTMFLQKASFAGTFFNAETDFSTAEFFADSDFSGASFDGRTDFSSTSFAGETSFAETIFKKRVYFKNATFKDRTLFHNVNLEDVTFDRADLSKVSFMGANLRKVDLVIPKWPKRHGRDMLPDETEARTNEEFIRVGMLYRMLKQKCKEQHDEAEASNWHYGEKEMYRKSNSYRRFFPLSLSNLYWFSSGYGERPVRAFVVLVFLFLTASFLSACSGLICTANSCYGIARIGVEWPYCPQWDQIGATMLNTLNYVTFQKEALFHPTGMLGDLVRIVFQLLIPLQTALLVLAVRNRFRR
ncbi:MAG: Pentapeptide repeats (8 copies) [Syntrophorhabdus sp. PtaU1.Bin153]|nr:MAG: Pentapeptide repeats (8 copies) [Syntrophorhabdus sp. PtaU1.Bin153]